MPTPQRRRKDSARVSEVAGIPATLPTATATVPPVERTPVEPTHDEIARCAYQLYEQRGGVPARDWDDWFEAERDLRNSGRVTSSDRIHLTRFD